MLTALRTRMSFLLAACLLAAGPARHAIAQSVDARLLSTPVDDSVRCIASSRLSPPMQMARVHLYAYQIGAPELQVRNAARQTMMTGPSPRVAVAIFDQSGNPVALVDSVFAAWVTWVAEVEFDPSSRRQSYIQASSVDSAEAMAIATRLGPRRLREVGDSAERLRKSGQKQLLDSAALRRARQMAELLWTQALPLGLR
jgi:hypothetical protein